MCFLGSFLYDEDLPLPLPFTIYHFPLNSLLKSMKSEVKWLKEKLCGGIFNNSCKLAGHGEEQLGSPTSQL